MPRRLLPLLLLAGALAPGCARGLLYTRVTEPLDLQIEATPAQPRTGESDWKTFSYLVHLDWDSSAIADAARAAGLVELHFADVETTSIFFGAWSQRRAIVYGR